MIYFAKWKIILVIAICVLGLAFAAPNFIDRDTAEGLPDWLPNKQISLGLDLQGGSHLLLQVETDVVVAEQLEAVMDGIRAEMRRERIRYRELGVLPGAEGDTGHGVQVTINDPEDFERARAQIRESEPQALVSSDPDTGKIELTFNSSDIVQRRQSALSQSIEIIRRRIDETGVREPTIQAQTGNRVLVQLPGVEDPERIKQLLGKTAKMTFHLVDVRNSVAEATAGRVPPGSRLLPSSDERNIDDTPVMYLVEKRVMISGENLVDSQPTLDARTNQPVVSFRFDSLGAKKFGDVTSANVNRPFAIVLDDEIISAPVIREPILGGNGQISGNFSFATANDLALLLRAGALPAPLTILEERTVGPGLGADSVTAGKVASIIGLTGVIIFMAAVYRRFGLMADVALAMNIFLIMAALSVLQATLTLPGIAGIVLTIGMAVDANVLVFERIREEVRAGRTPISSVDAGYARAFQTIIDANLTTLIAAVLLYIFGSGPIRGFAVTLAIGIVTSMFTAIMLTRLMVVTWLRRTRPQELKV